MPLRTRCLGKVNWVIRSDPGLQKKGGIVK